MNKFLSTAAFLLLPSMIFSQIPTFTNVGPTDVYYVTDILFGTNDKIFLGTVGGLYESTDRGASWKRPANFSSSIYLEPKFTVNKRNGDIYMYSSQDGIYHTNNNGESWLRDYVQGSQNIRAMAVSGDTIYVGSSGGLAHGKLNSSSTQLVNVTTFTGMSITTILMNGRTIVVGTEANGIFISRDGGQTWGDKSSGLPFDQVTTVVLKDNKLFVGFRVSGVYLSENWGTGWTEKKTGFISPHIVDMQIEGDQLYALTDGYKNIFVSALDASPWTLKSGLEDKHFLSTALAVKNNTIVIGFWHAIYRSEDQGATWKEAMNGVNDAFAFLSLQESSDGTLWAIASHTGVYKKRKSDAEFLPFKKATGFGNSSLIGDTLPIVESYTIKMYNVLHNTWGREIMLADVIFPSNLIQTQEGLFLSTLLSGVYRYSGTSWVAFNEGLSDLSIKDFKANKGVLYVSSDDGFFRRSPGETGWTKVNFASNDPGVGIMEINDSFIVLACADYTTHISDDGGLTWRKIPALNTFLYEIYLHGDRLYASGFSQLFVSDDKGKTWMKVPLGNIVVEAMIVQDDIIYLGTKEKGIWASPLNQSQQITGFELSTKTVGDPPFKLLAEASSKLPVTFTSSDNSVISIKNDTATIVAAGTATIKATQSGNIFYAAATVEKMVTVAPVVGIEPGEDHLSNYAIFPNPGRGEFIIEAHRDMLLNEKNVRITDILGRSIDAIVSKEDETNVRVRLIDSHDGQFIVLIKDGKRTAVRKFVNKR